jgi:hypothetical protein
VVRFWLCCLITLSVCSANAEVRRHKHYTGVYLGVGVAFPTGDLADNWSLGAHGSAGIGFPVSNQVEFVPSVQVYSFSLEDDRYRMDDGSYTDVQIGLDFKINFPPRQRIRTAMPYIIAGMGLAIRSVSITPQRPRVGYDDTATDGFLAIGFGVELGKAFLQLRYNHVFDNIETEFVPFTVGLRL